MELQVPEGNQVLWVQPENMVQRVTEDQGEGKDRKDREDNQEFLENRDSWEKRVRLVREEILGYKD